MAPDTKRVNVAVQFSRHPAGRYLGDGPFSGEAFRAQFLVPALKANTTIIVELDGGRGYGSSFLEEAFGGLVRLGYAPDVVKQYIVLESKDQTLIDEILEYINHGNEPPDE